jgi:hypothetical protein
VAEIRFDFLGDTSDLQASLREASDLVGEFDKKATAAAKKVAGVFAGVSAAATAGGLAIAAVAKATADLSAKANHYAKAAKKVGSTAEDIQRVEGAFALLTAGGVDAGNMIQDLNRGLAEARDGAGPAKDALAKLGLTAGDLVGLPIADQMELIASRFGTLGDIADKTQVSLDLFAEAGRELVPAFDAGGPAIAEAFKQIEAAGIISNETAAASEDLEDAILLVGREFDSLKRDAIEPLIPQMLEMVQATRDMFDAASATDALPRLAQWLLDVGYGAGIAATKLGEVLGILGKAPDKEGGIFADSEAIREQVKAIEALQAALDASQKTAEQYADASGAWRESDLADWERTNEALKAAQATFKALKKEAGGPVLPASGPATGGTPRKKAASGDDDGLAKMLAAQQAVGEALAGLASQAEDLAAKRAGAEAEVLLAAERTADGIKETLAGIVASTVASEQQKTEAVAAASESLVLLEEDTQARIAEIRANAAAEEQAVLEQVAAERLRRHEEELAQIAEAKAARSDALNASLGAASSVFGSIGSLVQSVAEIDIAASGKTSAERRKAMKAAWEAQTALAIAQAAINIPLSISQAAAGPWPAAIGFMVAAGVASAAGLAGVIAKAAAGPTFHSGGVATAGDVGGLGPDEFSAVLRRGEGVLTPAAVQRVGGADGVQALNRGDGGSGGPMVVAVQLNNRTVDLQQRAALQRPDSPLSSALRASQPRKLGRHNPWSG